MTSFFSDESSFFFFFTTIYPVGKCVLGKVLSLCLLLKQYFSLKNFLREVNLRNIFAIRQQWEQVITASCNYNTIIPCRNCTGCWRKYIQLIIVIKCASGVSDKIVIKHWSLVFNTEPYRSYGLKEWNDMSYEHLAALCEPCSCWIKNTLYLKSYLRYLWKQNRSIPKQLSNLMTVAGYSLKSSALVLQTFYNKPMMVAVDRHLHRSFLALGWVHAKSSTDVESSINIGMWLPFEEYIGVNNVIAGICQLLQDSKTRNHILSLSKTFGVETMITILDEISQSKKGKKINIMLF